MEIFWSRKTGKILMGFPPAPPEFEEVAEAIPDRYNIMSKMKADLKPDDNKFDCELNSK